MVAKKVLKFDLTPGATTGRKLLGSVDGQGSAVNQFGGVGDNELTTSVASNDLFWCIVGGPVEVLYKDGESIAVNIIGRALVAEGTTSSTTGLIQVAVNI